MKKLLPYVLLLSVCTAAPALADEIRDGKLYDPGIEMDAPAEGAVENLGQAAHLIGTYTAEAVTLTPNGELKGSGKIVITWMNRGHSIMIRGQVRNMYGLESANHIIAFLSYAGGAQTWQLGRYDSSLLAMRMYNGEMKEGRLVLENGTRFAGVSHFQIYRTTITKDSDGGLVLTEAVKSSNEDDFRTLGQLFLTPVEAGDDFLPVADGFGSPAPDRPEESAQFDFLIGEYNALNVFPPNPQNQQERRFNATTTAVYAAGGYVQYEFMWYDVDPGLPDAAVSVLRAYNPNTRRWESMYHANRGDAILHFGGNKEGDTIVLHSFNVHAAGPWNLWTFHNITDNGYDWYGQNSQDRGKTWRTGWIIEARPRK